MQSKFFQPKWIVLFLLIAGIVAIVAFFLFSPDSNQAPVVVEDTVTSSSTATAVTPTVISELSSPISPVSPLSPIQNSPEQALSPEKIQSVLEEGIQYFENKDYDRAMALFNQVLDQNPDTFLAYNARGTVYQAMGQFEKALADYSKSLEIEPVFPHPYYNRGRLYFSLKQYDEALADLKKAIELAPDEFGYRANGNIGLVYHQVGDYEKAIEAFNTSISYNVDNRADVYYFRAESYTTLADYASAIADYQAAIERFANYPQAYQSLGYAHYKTGQFDLAIDNLNKAIEISPNNAVANFYLALVYLATDRVEEAESSMSQGVNFLDTLSEDERHSITTRVMTDLEALSQEQPDKANTIENLIKLIP